MLNELTFAAMPAMNAASRPASATPSMPLGSTSLISSDSALLWVIPSPTSPALTLTSCGTSTPAIMPGMTMTNGMSAFGNAAMIGVRRAADMFFADRARWTSAKFVVQ